MNQAEIRDTIRTLVIESLDEMIDNVQSKPESRRVFVEAFAEIFLDGMASYVEHLAKRAAADRGIEIREH
ncbi:MAG: hypothetical protein KGJ54_06375 [Betaproteobacteria bacterium]|nr:hypothetical protein [Betaproteobacteria bacterium]